MRFPKNKIGNEEWYGGKEKKGECIFQRKLMTVKNDTF